MLTQAISDLQQRLNLLEVHVQHLTQRVAELEGVTEPSSNRPLCTKCGKSYTPGSENHYCTDSNCPSGLLYWDPNKLPV